MLIVAAVIIVIVVVVSAVAFVAILQSGSSTDTATVGAYESVSYSFKSEPPFGQAKLVEVIVKNGVTLDISLYRKDEFNLGWDESIMISGKKNVTKWSYEEPLPQDRYLVYVTNNHLDQDAQVEFRVIRGI